MLALQEVAETIEIWMKFDVNHEGTKTSVISNYYSKYRNCCLANW